MLTLGRDVELESQAKFYLKLATTWAGMGFQFDPLLLGQEAVQVEADQALQAYVQWLDFGPILGRLTKAILRVATEFNGEEVCKLIRKLEGPFDLVAFRYMMGQPLLAAAVTADNLDIGAVNQKMDLFYEVGLDFKAHAGIIGKAWLGETKMPVMGIGHFIFFDKEHFAKKTRAIISRGRRSSFWKKVYVVPCVYDVQGGKLLEHSGAPFYFGVTVGKGELYKDFRRVFELGDTM